MELNKIIPNLIEDINNLKNLTNIPKSKEQNNPLTKESQEYNLILKIVEAFDIILSNNFSLKQKDKENKENNSDNNNYYNSFIIKHFNTPLIRFFLLYNDSLTNNNKKNWIFLSILENSFSDCIFEIYQQNLDKKYYNENALIRINKSEINKILKTLKYIELKNIQNDDYDKYLTFLEEQSISSLSEDQDMYLESQISHKSNYISIFSDVSIIKRLEKKTPEKNKENYDYKIIKDFSSTIINNFYSFIAQKEHKDKDNKDNKEKENALNKNAENNNNNIEHDIMIKEEEKEINNDKDNNNNDKEEEKNISEEEEESDSNLSNTDSEDDSMIKTGLLLNPINNKFLPTDNLYQIKTKTKGLNQKYDYNDKLIYKKKETPITNSLLFYLNNFYKKTPYHKFYNHKMNDTPISLKEQNYQCSLCFKKFSTFFNIPIEPIYWCSYYMRFICKDCIADNYSVIPYFILALWKFDKYPISKQAKIILEIWYDKPVIYFKKKDKFVKLIPQLDEVVQIKYIINIMFDKMKCKNKFEFLKNNFKEYQYLVLKENIFSIKDLVEIKNEIFWPKIKKFFDIMVKHVSGECDECYIEGQYCRCESPEMIYLYDYKKVFYCPICDLCFHRKCKGLVGYLCGHE